MFGMPPPDVLTPPYEQILPICTGSMTGSPSSSTFRTMRADFVETVAPPSPATIHSWRKTRRSRMSQPSAHVMSRTVRPRVVRSVYFASVPAKTVAPLYFTVTVSPDAISPDGMPGRKSVAAVREA